MSDKKNINKITPEKPTGNKLASGLSKYSIAAWGQISSITLASLGLTAMLLSGCTSLKRLPPSPRLDNPSANLQQVWSKHSATNTAGQYLVMNPKVANNILYSADAKGKVMALSTFNGRTIWQNNTHTPITSSVALGPKHVFVGTAAGNLLALSRRTGKRQWFSTVPSSIIAPPTVIGQRVYVKTENSVLYAFNANNGHIIWNYPVASPDLVIRLGGAVVPYQTQVIVGYANGQLASLNQASGFPNWRLQFARPQGSTMVARMVDIDADLQVSGQTLYVVSYRGRLAALNAKNGRIIWQHPLSSFSGMTLDKQALYVTDVAGRLWAFNRMTGQVLWQQRRFIGRGLGAPSVMQNHILVGDAGGNLYAFSTSSGKLEAMTHMTGSPIAGAPTICNHLIIAHAQNGRVKAYRLKQA